jgi:transposase
VSDETRVGLLTVARRKLTGFGVKPIGQQDWEFCYRWLYGAFEPKSGESLLMEYSHLDGECFGDFLRKLSQQYPNELHLVQVDNAPGHRSQQLEIPENVVLVFQPPYCPEVNGAERVWEELKNDWGWMRFSGLEDLQHRISQWVKQLSATVVQKLTQWDWLMSALSVAGL